MTDRVSPASTGSVSARPVARYTILMRLKTAAIAVLATSLFWIAFMILYWPRAGTRPVDVRPDAGPSTPGNASSRKEVSANGEAATYTPPAGGLTMPVPGVAANQLTDTFSQSRAGGTRAHNAIDIMAPRGTPVVAAAAGTVARLFLSRNGGNTIYERSPDGRAIYYYAHLDSYAVGLADGMTLVPGQPLGFVGTSGDADPGAPHLHFAIMALVPGERWWQGQPINPYRFLGGQ